jgi:hypothetical protein
MIKREDLKKGDHVLEIASSYSPRDIDKISELVVVTIGPKYIGCQHIHDGEAYGQVQKYNNDERMGMKDWSQWKLFLGTKDEYLQEIETQKKCNELCREIDRRLYAGLGYEKLVAIKTIIESDDLKKTLVELSENI